VWGAGPDAALPWLAARLHLSPVINDQPQEGTTSVTDPGSSSSVATEMTPPAPAAAPGRRHRAAAMAGRRAVDLLRHAPVTVGLLVILWVVGAATGSLRARPSGPGTGGHC